MFFSSDWPVVRNVLELAPDDPARQRAAIEEGLRDIGQPVKLAQLILDERTDVLRLHDVALFCGADPEKIMDWIQVDSDIVRIMFEPRTWRRTDCFFIRHSELLFHLRRSDCKTAFDVARHAVAFRCTNNTVLHIACVGLPRGEPTDDNMRAVASGLSMVLRAWSPSCRETWFDRSVFDFFVDLAIDASDLQKCKILRGPVTSLLSEVSWCHDLNASLNAAYFKAAKLGLLNVCKFHSDLIAHAGSNILQKILERAGRPGPDIFEAIAVFCEHWQTASLSAACDPAPSVALASLAEFDDEWRARFMKVQQFFAAPMHATQ